MAQTEEEMMWLFDSVIGFLKGPEWALPVMSFIDDNCIVFDSEDENKLAYMDIYVAFREMVESLMELHLQDMGCTTAQFAELCAVRGTTDVGREVLEQILAVDDFVSFKKMMVKRNMELELESLKALQALSEQIAQGGGAEAEVQGGGDDDDFEAQLQAALELSLKEAESQGISTNIDSSEIDRKAAEAEDADLRMALALSLQLEDEKQKLEAIASTTPPAAPPAAPAPAPAPAPPPPLAPVDGPKPGSLASMGALAPLPGRTMAPLAGQDLRAAQAAANEAASRAAVARERAEKERAAAKEAAASQEMSVARAAEVRARAEHLKKQRDLLVAKRKKEREEQFKADPNAGAAAPAPPPRAVPQAEAMRGAAGFTSESKDANDESRAMLSRTLAANMKASLLGEDVSSLELQQRIDSHQRKADFEATKAQLLAEVESAKARGTY